MKKNMRSYVIFEGASNLHFPIGHLDLAYFLIGHGTPKMEDRTADGANAWGLVWFGVGMRKYD